MKIYIVEGHTGQYEDYRRWQVCAFPTKIKANRLCQKLNQFCKDKGCDTGRGEFDYVDEKFCPLDPKFYADFLTGTKYSVASLELRD